MRNIFFKILHIFKFVVINILILLLLLVISDFLIFLFQNPHGKFGYMIKNPFIYDTYFRFSDFENEALIKKLKKDDLLSKYSDSYGVFPCLYDNDISYNKTYCYNLANMLKKTTKIVTSFENDFNINDTYNYYTIDEAQRRFVGLEYKNKKPIILFGCSYTFGDEIKYYQTFGYKLSRYLQVPVYNRGISAGGIQITYTQSLSDELYNEVPASDNIIYVLIGDHYRRMFGSLFTIFDPFFYIHYKFKNGEFIIDNYNNYLLNFFKSSYTLRSLYSLYINHYIKNKKNADKITNSMVLYFIKIRKNLEAKWGNKINFSILFYDNIPFSDMLKLKLEQNGFNIIETNELTEENLLDENINDIYQASGHPTEAAWDLLTPLIAEKLQLE